MVSIVRYNPSFIAEIETKYPVTDLRFVPAIKVASDKFKLPYLGGIDVKRPYCKVLLLIPLLLSG